MNNLSGIGIWIWKIAQCENGNWDSIIQKCIDHDIKWIAVKIGEHTRDVQWTKEFAVVAIEKCHNAGLKILGWNYSRPSSYEQEILLLSDCISDGLDGICVDAEIEWQQDPNAYTKADHFMRTLRDNVGNDIFIAHAPFPIVSYHQSFPYAVFGKYVDAVFPQSYWTELKWTVDKTISMTDSNFNQFNTSHSEAAKPVWPIGVSYGQGYPGISEPLTKEDILTFLNHYKGLPISFYSYDASANFPQFWEALKEFKAQNQRVIQPVPTPIPAPTPAPEPSPINIQPQTKPIILDIILKFLSSLFK
jgi:hypothetical protein